MRGSLPLGLVIGLIVGAGGMILVLRPPWTSNAAAPSDAGVVAEAPGDGGVKKKKKGRRPGGGNRPGPGGEDEDWLNSGGGEETEPPRGNPIRVDYPRQYIGPYRPGPHRSR